jgi:hypothetical protein
MKYIIGYRPVSLYNCSNQELIGIFKYKVLVARYVFKNYNCDKNHLIEYCLKRNGRIVKDLNFNFKIALRYSNEEQIKLLGEKDFIILKDYYKPESTRMNGFNYSTSKINKK